MVDVDFSLIDVGHAEAGLEVKDGNLYVGAFASAWSPSFSVNIFGATIEIGAEVGSVGGSINVGTGVFSAYEFGFYLSVTGNKHNQEGININKDSKNYPFYPSR